MADEEPDVSKKARSKAQWKARDAQRVWTSDMGPCKHCGDNHLHSQCRRRKAEHLVIPIGYCCPTAEFLKFSGVRRCAAPLDWCKTTLPLWQHIINDKGQALSDEAQAVTSEDGEGKVTRHKTYNGELYPRVQLWLHGYDPPTWARRCERLRELLHDAPAGGECAQVLALHIDFEVRNANCSSVSSGVANSVSSGMTNSSREELQSSEGQEPVDVSQSPGQSPRQSRLDAFVQEAVELGATAGRATAGAHLHVVAVLFVPSASESAAQCDVAAGRGGERLALESAVAGDGSGCFARCACSPNVTVLRYVLPHERRNGAGNPLPKGQNSLLPDDAERLQAVLRALFPLHFPTAAVSQAVPGGYW